jgi:hypothetical protein
MRVAGLSVFAAASAIAFLIVTAAPARSQPGAMSLHYDSNNVVPVKDAASRRARNRQAHRAGRYRQPKRLYRSYGYFGADPDRYFGVGPGSYECYGYDCNW